MEAEKGDTALHSLNAPALRCRQRLHTAQATLLSLGQFFSRRRELLFTVNFVSELHSRETHLENSGVKALCHSHCRASPPDYLGKEQPLLGYLHSVRSSLEETSRASYVLYTGFTRDLTFAQDPRSCDRRDVPALHRRTEGHSLIIDRYVARFTTVEAAADSVYRRRTRCCV